MKKLFISILVTILMIAMIVPATVNAATIVADKDKMEITDVVTLTVTTAKPVETVQFDLKFDNKKYKYVPDSVKSDLDTTKGELIASNILRISAFDLNGKTTDSITMQFEATNNGSNVPFTIVGNVEIGDQGETFDKSELKIEKIGTGEETTPGVDTPDGENPSQNGENGEYLDKDGNVITRLPQTAGKQAIGMYKKLIPGENVVAFALPYSDDTLSQEDLKVQFGSQITVTDNGNKGILGTGDTFTLNNVTYTIIIYGDVNGDGKVTTADALKARKIELGTITNATVFEKEALKVVRGQGKDNGDGTANALAIQTFILGKQENTIEQTIMDEYPEADVVSGNMIEGIKGEAKKPNRKFCFEDIEISTIQSTNNNAITSNIITYELRLENEVVNPNDKIAEVNFVETTPGSGVYTVKLYASKPGKYKITPIIVGENVKGGVQQGEAYEIQVEDNFEVTGIKVKKNNTEVSSIDLRVDATEQLTLEFVHEYVNVKPGYTKPAPVTVRPSDDQIQIIPGNGFFTSKTVYSNGVLTIEPAKEGVSSITINVNGVQKTINVTILPGAKIVGVNINGTNLTSTSKTLDPINLYLDKNYVDSTFKKVIKETDPVTGKVKDSILTILPIKLVNEDGKLLNSITRQDIKITETDDPGNGDIEVRYYSIEGLTGDASKDEAIYQNTAAYVEETMNTSRVDAIGIRLQPILVEGWLEYINKGITVEYKIDNGTTTTTTALKAYKNGKEVTDESQVDTEELPDDTTSKIEGITMTPKTPSKKTCYEEIEIAEIKSNNSIAITKDMLSYELKLDNNIVDPTSKTADVSFEETSAGSGIYTVKLYVAQPGSYTVTPIIKGDNVKDGEQRGTETTPIQISHDSEITDIIVKDGDKTLTGPVSVRMNAENYTKLNVECVHIYENIKAGYDTPEPISITNLSENAIEVTADSNYFTTNTKYSSGVLTIEPAKTGSSIINVALATNNEVKTQIPVTIKPEAQIKGIELDGTKLDNTSKTMPAINLYYDTNYVDNKIKITEKLVVEDGTGRKKDCTFVILPVKLLDEDNKTKRATVGDIDIAQVDPDGAEIRYQYYSIDGLTGNPETDKAIYANTSKYTKESHADAKIDAVGIALEVLLDIGWLDYIGQGITVTYNSYGTPTTATMDVNVYNEGKILTDEPEENLDPTPSPTPPTDNSGANGEDGDNIGDGDQLAPDEGQGGPMGGEDNNPGGEEGNPGQEGNPGEEGNPGQEGNTGEEGNPGQEESNPGEEENPGA